MISCLPPRYLEKLAPAREPSDSTVDSIVPSASEAEGRVLNADDLAAVHVQMCAGGKAQGAVYLLDATQLRRKPTEAHVEPWVRSPARPLGRAPPTAPALVGGFRGRGQRRTSGSYLVVARPPEPPSR